MKIASIILGGSGEFSQIEITLMTSAASFLVFLTKFKNAQTVKNDNISNDFLCRLRGAIRRTSSWAIFIAIWRLKLSELSFTKVQQSAQTVSMMSCFAWKGVRRIFIQSFNRSACKLNVSWYQYLGSSNVRVFHITEYPFPSIVTFTFTFISYFMTFKSRREDKAHEGRWDPCIYIFNLNSLIGRTTYLFRETKINTRLITQVLFCLYFSVFTVAYCLIGNAAPNIVHIVHDDEWCECDILLFHTRAKGGGYSFTWLLDIFHGPRTAPPRLSPNLKTPHHCCLRKRCVAFFLQDSTSSRTRDAYYRRHF